ncbi:MAG: 50S ribosomal protein L24 [Patescibacteria group bacterium]
MTKIKKGDTILVLSGKDRGKTGKVVKVFPKIGKMLVEGMNMQKKHLRPRKVGVKGEIVQKPAPFFISKAKLICPKCGKAARVGHKIAGDAKFRVCKVCKGEF